MTVIAYKNRVMAADTQLTQHNSKHRAQKIFRLPDGGIAAGCGEWSVAYAGLKFLADGGDPEREDPPDIKGATLLIAKPDGSLWVAEDRWPAWPLMDTEKSIGCGADAAEMAMRLGKSAPDAVALVIKQDALCGDPVQVMNIEPTHEYGAAKVYKKGRR